MADNQSKIELAEAYQEFSMKVAEAKKIYHQQIDEILQTSADLQVAKIKKNLNI